MKWVRSVLTDDKGEFDTGRILAPIAVAGMLLLNGWAVVVNVQHFDPQALGVGIGSVLGGLAAYLWGDKRPTPGVDPPAVEGEVKKKGILS